MKTTLKTVFNLVINDVPVTVWADTTFKSNDENRYNYFVKVTETSKLPKGGTTSELSAISDAIIEALSPNAESTMVSF